MADERAPGEDRAGAEPPRRAAPDDREQAARLECLGRLAASVAHDFNNVLTVILSCGHALTRAAEHGLPTPADDVRQLVEAAERARTLTQGLLAFGRRRGADPVPLDLNRVVERARGMLARLLGDRIELDLQLAPELWITRADASQLDQVLQNLVTNARDALPHGGRVRITTANAPRAAAPGTAGEPDRDEVRLHVRDDGVGMSPEVLARAFDPFFTTKGNGKGTGLGLATVHGIVSQSGGRIRVESAPGRGTRVELSFPRAEGAHVDAAPPRAAPAPAGGTEAILLVEDDPGVRRQALRGLAGAGYQVHVAADGEEALALLATLAKVPDLLLTDVVMPRLDGARLADTLQARWPGLRVLFTSGYTDERLGPEAEGGFLAKPFTVTQLLSRVREALDAPRPGAATPGADVGAAPSRVSRSTP